MSYLSLSSLSPSDLQECAEILSKELLDQVNAFVQKNLVGIATHYIDYTNSLQKRGFIRLNALQLEQIGDDPKYDLARGGEQIVWQYCFVPFDDECIPRDLPFFASLKHSSPYQMPIVFFDTRRVVSYKQTWYKADCPVMTGITVSLSPSVEDVAREEAARASKQQKPRHQPEQKLEDQLYDWLRIKCVDVERQVSTSKHRLDLWIPNKAMIELKQGRVSGDDVCQAIDYAATYKMPIVLVGTGLSSSASRGIDGFNRSMGKDLIIFVTWGGIRPYLSGILNLI